MFGVRDGHQRTEANTSAPENPNLQLQSAQTSPDHTMLWAAECAPQGSSSLYDPEVHLTKLAVDRHNDQADH
jgi:hypothetical protein